MIDYSHPDLTQHPPRSPRVRLGGCIHLPRLLDKARALAAGKNGEYNYPCPLDKQLLGFLGIDPDAVLAEAKKGRSDTEMLAWFNSQTKRSEFEIEAWSDWREVQGPGSAEGHSRFGASLAKAGSTRDDIQTSFDRLDLDDYVTFGGKG